MNKVFEPYVNKAILEGNEEINQVLNSLFDLIDVNSFKKAILKNRNLSSDNVCVKLVNSKSENNYPFLIFKTYNDSSYDEIDNYTKQPDFNKDQLMFYNKNNHLDHESWFEFHFKQKAFYLNFAENTMELLINDKLGKKEQVAIKAVVFKKYVNIIRETKSISNDISLINNVIEKSKLDYNEEPTR